MQTLPWRNHVVRSTFPNDVDALFQRMLSDFERPRVNGCASTPVDVLETADGYSVRVEAPGLAPSDFEVTLEDGVLTIAGRGQAEATKEGEKWLLRERRELGFRRSLRLPQPVDESNVRAEHRSGVLSIELKKLAPKVARKIEIQAS